MTDDTDLLIRCYHGFNARDIDTVLTMMHPDVTWPNGMEGGYVHGHDEVRAYWTRQWGLIDPHVEPTAIDKEEDGRMVVTVHQVVRSLDGAVIADRMVRHTYTIEEGLVRRMEIDDATA